MYCGGSGGVQRYNATIHAIHTDGSYTVAYDDSNPPFEKLNAVIFNIWAFNLHPARLCRQKEAAREMNYAVHPGINLRSEGCMAMRGVP